jgi:hypothetical protein
MAVKVRALVQHILIPANDHFLQMFTRPTSRSRKASRPAQRALQRSSANAVLSLAEQSAATILNSLVDA